MKLKLVDFNFCGSKTEIHPHILWILSSCLRDSVNSHGEKWCVVLTHPDFSKAALSKFEVKAERLPWDLPGVPSQSLGLRFGHRTHLCQGMAQPVRVL